jgi:hypothetical protein
VGKMIPIDALVIWSVFHFQKNALLSKKNFPPVKKKCCTARTAKYDIYKYSVAVSTTKNFFTLVF